MKSLSFTIERGEIVGVVGESGAGKSTVGNAVIDLLSPPGKIASGDVYLDGEKISGLSPEAMRRVRDQGWELVNVDSTIVAQAPKLAPHIAAINAGVAQALGVALDQVNVKAKTAEKLGPVGMGQSIEARAVALLHKPS